MHTHLWRNGDDAKEDALLWRLWKQICNCDVALCSLHFQDSLQQKKSYLF